MREYEVGTSDQPDRHGHVMLGDVSLGNIPSCTCPDFRSSLIPCSGICAVFNRTQDDIFSLQYVHRRWWLRLHPQYEAILRRNLRVPDPPAAGGDHAMLPERDASCDSIVIDEPAVAVRASRDDIYHRVVYPSK
ncbi:unnamed protein product (mitochondrion) [Plasmodiophora brassicae]|uniref:SWIM-type domain-containing protein n=1 Tax=Plasmodiophora brassicae TaxID=37360 RepID=A0A3P3YCU3_PLABS|nr:unnamed protein product [Plasmodiophora brassicae]